MDQSQKTYLRGWTCKEKVGDQSVAPQIQLPLKVVLLEDYSQQWSNKRDGPQASLLSFMASILQLWAPSSVRSHSGHACPIVGSPPGAPDPSFKFAMLHSLHFASLPTPPSSPRLDPLLVPLWILLEQH